MAGASVRALAVRARLAVVVFSEVAAPLLFGHLADTHSYDVGWTLLAGCTLVAGLLLVGLARE